MRKLCKNEKAGFFTSVWNSGYITINSKCIVNMETREIVKIYKSDAPHGIEEDISCLDKEYVVIDNITYRACHKDEFDGTGFYYS